MRQDRSSVSRRRGQAIYPTSEKNACERYVESATWWSATIRACGKKIMTLEVVPTDCGRKIQDNQTPPTISFKILQSTTTWTANGRTT
ncbi:hypothetical protein P4114_26330 [Pseudomonas aeruginosa]|nr:hypothetical protein [Pseudomonas aeruginosa]